MVKNEKYPKKTCFFTLYATVGLVPSFKTPTPSFLVFLEKVWKYI